MLDLERRRKKIDDVDDMDCYRRRWLLATNYHTRSHKMSQLFEALDPRQVAEVSVAKRQEISKYMRIDLALLEPLMHYPCCFCFFLLLE